MVITAIVTPPRGMVEALMAKWSDEEREKFQADAVARQEGLYRAVRDHGLWDHASPTEREIFLTNALTITVKQQITASWRLESAQVLMWALGLVSALPPYDADASRDLVKLIPSSDPTDFIAKARLRIPKAIDQARSVAEFWHWRSRTRQLIAEGRPFPVNAKMAAKGIRSYDDIVSISARKGAADGVLPPAIAGDFAVMGKAYRDLTTQEWAKVRSITMERHVALNWMCGYAPDNRWDDTPTET
jgi:hypothetical protein